MQKLYPRYAFMQIKIIKNIVIIILKNKLACIVIKVIQVKTASGGVPQNDVKAIDQKKIFNAGMG